MNVLPVTEVLRAFTVYMNFVTCCLICNLVDIFTLPSAFATNNSFVCIVLNKEILYLCERNLSLTSATKRLEQVENNVSLIYL